MKKMIKVLPLLILFIYVFSRGVPLVFAQGAQTAPACNGQMTDFGCLPSDVPGFVTTLYGWGLSLISFVAVLFIIIGGYFILTSRGDVEALQKGKSFIFYAIAGVLLAVLGFVFIEIVTGQILKIPGFS
ncbi:MAG TPA: hypothetical protein VG965_01135 [Patescibacteria group bacterium]|nr:hypothetical protein [Patescibacteria group bacterium]